MSEKKKAMIVYGGWQGHEPKESAAFWAEELSAHGFEVALENSLDALLDTERVKELSLLIPNWTMGELTKEQTQGFTEAATAGVGIAGFHGGMGDAFRGNVKYHFITGAQFVSHPDGVKPYSVRILDQEDPITRGIDDFEIISEQYYMLIDPNFNVLADTLFTPRSEPWMDGRRMPVVMKKLHGSSRVFYSAIGHKVEDFKVPEVKEIQTRGFLWAAK